MTNVDFNKIKKDYKMTIDKQTFMDSMRIWWKTAKEEDKKKLIERINKIK